MSWFLYFGNSDASPMKINRTLDYILRNDAYKSYNFAPTSLMKTN